MVDEPRVLVEREASAREAAAVQAVVAEVAPWPVEAAFERKALGPESLPWVVYIVAPLSAVMSAFGAAFGKELGKASGVAIADWLKRLRAARSGSKGGITLIDEDSGTWVSLDPDYPPEAYEALKEVDPANIAGDLGVLRWSYDDRRWAPPS